MTKSGMGILPVLVIFARGLLSANKKGQLRGVAQSRKRFVGLGSIAKSERERERTLTGLEAART